MNVIIYDGRRNGEVRSLNGGGCAATLPAPPDSAMDAMVVDVDALSQEELIAVLDAQRPKAVCVVGVTASEDPEELGRLLAMGLDGLVAHGASEPEFLRTVLVVRHHLAVRRRLEQRLDEMQQKLEDRKVIERAKGIIAQRAQTSEEEALRRLRREARNQRRPMRDIAQTVVDADRMLKAEAG